MALTYGFYNSVNHDRLYDAIQFGQIFDGIISDGVYANYKQALMVKASTEDNEVIVQPGRAWFDHTWTYNDANLPITTPAPALILDRIDALCLDINADTTKRANTLVWIKGTEATNPVKPTNFIHTETQHQYPLCFVRRRADTARIRQADIENAIGTSLCPFVTGIIDTIKIDALIAQWGAQWNDWTDEQRTAFTEWFSNLQHVLDGDVAGHLQNEIDALENVLKDISYFEGDDVPSDGVASRNYKEGALIWFPLESSFYVAWDNISVGSQFTESNLRDIHSANCKNLYDYIMDDIKTKYDYVNTRIANVNTDLSNRIATNTNSINSVSSRVTGNTNSINNLNSRVTTNTNSINSHTNTLNSHTSSINNHTSRIGTLENEFTANGKRIYLDYKNGKYGINTAAGRGADTFIPFNNLDDVKVYSNQWTHARGGESHDSGVFASYTLQRRSKVYVQCAAVTATDASGGCWSNVTNGKIYPAGTKIDFSYSYDADEWNRNMQYVASLAAIST